MPDALRCSTLIPATSAADALVVRAENGLLDHKTHLGPVPAAKLDVARIDEQEVIRGDREQLGGFRLMDRGTRDVDLGLFDLPLEGLELFGELVDAAACLVGGDAGLGNVAPQGGEPADELVVSVPSAAAR